MKILLIEPYYSGSHRAWADLLCQKSSHEILIWTLPGKHWKWRMHGAAIYFASRYKEEAPSVDVILVSGMMDLAVFDSLAHVDRSITRLELYLHENQLSYPWGVDRSEIDKTRDRHYGFINYSSALTADRVFFNSRFHKEDFLRELRIYLGAFPDFKDFQSVDIIGKKSEVWYPAIDRDEIDANRVEPHNPVPVVLWNHRWEHDKRPEKFFEILEEIQKIGTDFKLVILGESYARSPASFARARTIFSERLLHFGYCESRDEYCRWLWRSDILLVTSIQENFGLSVMEAAYAGVTPILPKRLVYPELFGSQEEFFYEEKSVAETTNRILNQSLVHEPSARAVASRFGFTEYPEI